MDALTTTVFAGAGLDARAIENPSCPLEPEDWLPAADWQANITPTTALNLAAVWQATNVLSGDVAQLPVKVFRRRNDGGREADRAHPTWRLLHRQPAEYLGPFQFKQLMMFRALLWGNAYAFIARKSGVPVALRPLEPESVVPEMKAKRLVYKWTDENGNQDTLDSSDVFHLRGPGGDTLQGQSVITNARDSLAVGRDAQRYGANFFRNNAAPRVALSFPDALDGTAAKNILRHWERRHAGAENAGRAAILDRGGKVELFSMSNEDAQFLETREFSRTEVASWFNLPPHKVGDLTRATFSNIEQQSIDYVTYSLTPWLVRWQDECNAKLFLESEIAADSHYCEFEVNALLRGDAKSRSEFYNNGVMGGWLVRNEVRALENMNALEGLDEPLQPLNMVTPGEAEAEDDETPPPEDDSDDLRGLYETLLQIAVERAHRRMISAAARSAGTLGALGAFVDGDLPRQRASAVETLETTVEKGRSLGLLKCSAADIADKLTESVRRALLEELEKPAKGLKERVNSHAATPFVDAAAILSEV